MKAALFLLLSTLMSNAIAQSVNVLELSRNSGVRVISKVGNSSGSGFFVGDQYVLTCFHVAAAITVEGNTIKSTIFPDLQVILPSGEQIGAAVVSMPTEADPSPVQ